MSTTNEAFELLTQIAGPQTSVKQVLVAAHRALAKHNWSFNRVRDVYHRDNRIRIRADELAQLRTEAAKKDRAIADAATDAYADMLARISRLETAMGISDPQFFEPQIDGMRHVAGAIDQPVDRMKER